MGILPTAAAEARTFPGPWRPGGAGERGDERVFWVARLEQVIPVGREEVAIFGDGAWRTIPSGAAAWQTILASLPLRLEEDDEVDSVLRAFEAFGGTVLRNVDAARQIAAPPTDDEATWRFPPKPGSPEILDQFEPPHREGRHQVFCANVGFHQETRAPACVRVVVDIDTLASTVTWLCMGRSPGQRFVLRGRALVDHGVALTAAVRASGMDAAMTTTSSTVMAWQEAAAAEHASIASFARATLELMAVGPLSLVARTGQAAVDEVRHARLSLAVARRATTTPSRCSRTTTSTTATPPPSAPCPWSDRGRRRSHSWRRPRSSRPRSPRPSRPSAPASRRVAVDATTSAPSSMGSTATRPVTRPSPGTSSTGASRTTTTLAPPSGPLPCS